MTEYGKQLAVLLTANPHDEDFLEKIKRPRADLDRFIAADSISLSQGVLTLLGFLPGNWLDQIPGNQDVWFKLQNELGIYLKAKEAIRGRFLDASLEGDIYYVRPRELIIWFLDKNIYIHSTIVNFLNDQLGLKRRGRPKDDSHILEQIADHFREVGVQELTTVKFLIENKAIESLVQEYCKGLHPEQHPRRLQTLRCNINRLLASKSL